MLGYSIKCTKGKRSALLLCLVSSHSQLPGLTALHWESSQITCFLHPAFPTPTPKKDPQPNFALSLSVGNPGLSFPGGLACDSGPSLRSSPKWLLVKIATTVFTHMNNILNKGILLSESKRSPNAHSVIPWVGRIWGNDLSVKRHFWGRRGFWGRGG